MANMSEPMQYNGLVVECEDCGFVYSADHKLEEGGYDCPNCNEIELEVKNKRLHDLNQHLKSLIRATHYSDKYKIEKMEEFERLVEGGGTGENTS